MPTLSVPASTSNLGPGFDFLGLALALRLELRAEFGSAERSGSDGAALVYREREGEAAHWPESGDLVGAAFARGLQEHSLPPRSLLLSARSEIPIERGLGSSGAAVAAGLLFADECARLEGRAPLGPERLAELGLALEGHPDNSTASLLGGCTLGIPLDSGRLRIVRAPVSDSLRVAVAWPERRVSTADARAVLPKDVPFADAVENPRRLALLLEGLRTADSELLREGVRDRLHVDRRLPLIPGASAALASATELGAAATISGSGSALVALVCAPEGAADVAEAMKRALVQAGGVATARVLDIVQDAPRVSAGA